MIHNFLNYKKAVTAIFAVFLTTLILIMLGIVLPNLTKQSLGSDSVQSGDINDSNTQSVQIILKEDATSVVITDDFDASIPFSDKITLTPSFQTSEIFPIRRLDIRRFPNRQMEVIVSIHQEPELNLELDFSALIYFGEYDLEEFYFERDFEQGGKQIYAEPEIPFYGESEDLYRNPIIRQNYLIPIAQTQYSTLMSFSFRENDREAAMVTINEILDTYQIEIEE